MKIEIKDILKDKVKFDTWYYSETDTTFVDKPDSKKQMVDAKNDLIISIINNVFPDLLIETTNDLTWHALRDPKFKKYCDQLKNVLSDIKTFPRVLVENEVPLAVWESYRRSSQTLKEANIIRNKEIASASLEHKKSIMNADKRFNKIVDDLHVTFKITKIDYRYLPIETRSEFRDLWRIRNPQGKINSSEFENDWVEHQRKCVNELISLEMQKYCNNPNDYEFPTPYSPIKEE